MKIATNAGKEKSSPLAFHLRPQVRMEGISTGQLRLNEGQVIYRTRTHTLHAQLLIAEKGVCPSNEE